MTAPCSLRVAVDCRMLFHSGIGRYLREILAAAPVEPGWRWCFLVADARAAAWLRDRFPDAEVRPARSRIYSPWEQLEIPWLTLDCDILWVPHYNLPLLARPALLTTVHDVAHRALPDIFRSRAMQVYARVMMRGVLARAARIITVSGFTRDEIGRFFGHQRPDIRVIWNGATALPVDPAPQLPPSPFLLFVGNFKPHKNLERLLEAFELLPPGNLRLVVAGQVAHAHTASDEALLRRLRASPRIEIVDSPTDEQIGALLAHCAGLVFPSRYEGFGLPVVEAFLAGNPVVASRLPSLLELFPGDDSVVWVDSSSPRGIAEGIRQLLEMAPAERQRRVENGRRIAAGLSWRKTAAETFALLRELATQADFSVL